MNLLMIIGFIATTFLTFLPLTTPSLTSSRTALLFLQSSLKPKQLNWTLTHATPCNWEGIKCENITTQGLQVTTLRLPGVGLQGEIPLGIFSNLTFLKTISLRWNAISGRIPGDIGSCFDLRNLYLYGNKFSGEVPEGLFKLVSLVRLNIAENNLSGGVKWVDGLVKLKTLYLERNGFDGKLPKMEGLKGLGQFNVSFNRFQGRVPKSVSGFGVESFFGQEELLCGGPLRKCPKKKLSGGAIAGIVIGSLVGGILLLVVLILVCRRKRSGEQSGTAPVRRAERPMEGEMVRGVRGNVKGNGEIENGGVTRMSANRLVFFGNEGRYFDLEDLLKASAEVLGKGTFGTGYKAMLTSGALAVKRLKDVSVSEREYREKIEVVGKMEHENILPLRAYYFSTNEKLLVSDYMPVGSLSALLHGNRGSARSPLNWETRCRIALGAARGIEYIHSRGRSISHGNIKSSNILLTNAYTACVSDYCLANIVGSSSIPNHTGSYRAPEITDGRKISQKADVYSFGVLLLELLTGRIPIDSSLHEEDVVDLPRWVESVLKEDWIGEVFDLELLRYQGSEEEMNKLLQLALYCAAQHPDKRPSMSEVVQKIDELYQSSLQEEQQDQFPEDLDDDSSSLTHRP